MKANLVLSLSVALAMVFAYASFVKAPQIIDTDFSGGTASGVVISSGSLQLQPPSASWWDTSWNYRMRLDVTPVSYDRKRATIGPFSVSFPPSCQGCALDENSLRIVQKGAFCDQSGSCKPNLNDWVKEDLLSGLTEFQKTGNTSSFTQLGIAKNVDFNGNPIDIAGMIYSSGILQVPNSGAGGEAAVTYKMNRQYSRFRATLGLDYSTDQAQADMNCAVLVDSASVAGRPLDMLADTLNIDIDVTGKDELTLECDNADSSNAGDWAVWGNARLSRWTNTTPVTEDPGREISLGIPPVKSYGDTLIYNDFEKSANTWFKRTSGSAAAASQDSQGSRGSSKSLKVVMTQSDGPRNNNLLEDQAGDYYTDDFPYIIFDYQMPTTARAALYVSVLNPSTQKFAWAQVRLTSTTPAPSPDMDITPPGGIGIVSDNTGTWRTLAINLDSLLEARLGQGNHIIDAIRFGANGDGGGSFNIDEFRISGSPSPSSYFMDSIPANKAKAYYVYFDSTASPKPALPPPAYAAEPVIVYENYDANAMGTDGTAPSQDGWSSGTYGAKAAIFPVNGETSANECSSQASCPSRGEAKLHLTTPYPSSDHQLCMTIVESRLPGDSCWRRISSYSVTTADGWTTQARYSNDGISDNCDDWDGNSQVDPQDVFADVCAIIPAEHIAGGAFDATFREGAMNNRRTSGGTVYNANTIVMGMKLTAGTRIADQEMSQAFEFFNGWRDGKRIGDRRYSGNIPVGSSMDLNAQTAYPGEPHKFVMVVPADRTSDLDVRIGQWNSPLTARVPVTGQPHGTINPPIPIPGGIIPAGDFKFTIVSRSSNPTKTLYANQWFLIRDAPAIRPTPGTAETRSTSSGVFESRTFDTGGNSDYDRISWSADMPPGTSARFQIATSSVQSGPFSYKGPDGTAGSFYSASGQPINPDHDGERYARYMAFLEAPVGLTPAVHDIMIAYNAPPSVAVDTFASIAPPTVSSPLNCSFVPSNPTGGDVTGDVGWTRIRQGVSADITAYDVAGIPCRSGATCYTTRLVPPGELLKGDEWRCTVTARSGGASSPETEDITGVVIQNSPPAGAAITSVSNSFTSHTFSITATVADPDGPGDIASCTVMHRQQGGGAFAEKPGMLTANTCDTSISSSEGYAPNSVVEFQVAFTDLSGEKASTQASSHAIPNQPPVASSLQVLPLTAGTDDMLTCDFTYFDPEGDQPGSHAFKWFRGAQLQAALTAQAVEPSLTARGESWSCQVTPLDALGAQGQPKDSTSRTISNSPPNQPSSVSITTASPMTSSIIACSSSGISDPDGDTVEAQYEFRDADGLLQAYSTNSTFACSKTGCDKGDSIYCYAKGRDVQCGTAAACFGQEKASQPVAVLNSPPVALQFFLVNFPRNSSFPLNLTQRVFNDPDGDPLSYGMASARPQNINVAVSGDTAVLTPDIGFFGNRTIRFNATDGSASADSATITIEVTINNAAPRASIISPQNGTRLEFGLPAQFKSAATDADNNLLLFKWYFGDGFDSTEQNTTHAYTSLGTFIITFTANDTIFSDTKNITLSVADTLPPQASFTYNKSITIGNSLGVTAYAIDFSQIKSISLTYNGVPVQPSRNSTGGGGREANASWTLTFPAIGTNNITIEYSDIHGNTNTTALSFDVFECTEGEEKDTGSNIGECRPGKLRCVGGRFQLATPSVGPFNETCNGKDDDCDGQPDDGVSCTCSPGQVQSCGLSVGSCRPGAQACGQDGIWGQCAGGIGPVSEGQLCDGSDNDCNGITDDPFDFDRDGFLARGPACAAGNDCDDANANVNPNAAEICGDGRDNNCDGDIDEPDACTAAGGTCGNGVQDGDEEGVDCGGSCQACGSGPGMTGLILIAVGATVLTIIVALYLHFRSMGKELSWGELKKKWGEG